MVKKHFFVQNIWGGPKWQGLSLLVHIHTFKVSASSCNLKLLYVNQKLLICYSKWPPPPSCFYDFSKNVSRLFSSWILRSSKIFEVMGKIFVQKCMCSQALGVQQWSWVVKTNISNISRY